jgi:DNA-binding PadR family transcriptional regulator
MPESRDGATAPLTPVVFHVLLALLRGPLHGYGIMKRVEEASGIRMGPGTVYGSLNRLLDAGWVAELDPAVVEGTDPRRGRAFELTAAGLTAVRTEAERIRRLAGMEDVRRLAPGREVAG